MRRLAVVSSLAIALGLLLPQAATGSARAGEGMAFQILQDMAREDARNRTYRGIAEIGGGVVLGLVTGLLVNMASPEHALPAGLIVGGLFVLRGAFTLATPTQIERTHAEISALSPERREERSVLLLRQWAEAARQWRLVRAVTNGVWGLTLLAVGASSGEWFYCYLGFYNLGWMAYTLLVPSREERAFSRYQDLTSGRAESNGLALTLRGCCTGNPNRAQHNAFAAARVGLRRSFGRTGGGLFGDSTVEISVVRR